MSDTTPPFQGPERGLPGAEPTPPGPETSADRGAAPSPPPLPTGLDPSVHPIPPIGPDGGRGQLLLRPMRVGEMIDAAIKLYRANWATLIGIVAFVLVPYTFVTQFVFWTSTRPFEDAATLMGDEAGAALALGLVLTAVGFLIIQPFLTAAVARATSEVYLGGAPGVRETYRFALSRTHSILWVTLLYGLATLLGVLALIVGAVIVFVRLTFGTTIVVVEGKKGREALRRSWQLAKGFFWKLFGTLLLAGLLAQIISGILSFPLQLAAQGMGESGWFLAALGQSLAEIITTPFASIVGVLLYFDMRIRKEGLDLALMAQELERGPGGA